MTFHSTTPFQGVWHSTGYGYEAKDSEQAYRQLCDMGCVGHTNQHLHQHIAEHHISKSSTKKHMQTQYGVVMSASLVDFSGLKKRRNKFDCLLYEMLFKKELEPSFIMQSDSTCTEVFK